MANEIMAMVKIYNAVDPAVEADVTTVVLKAYATYCHQEEVKA